MSTLRIYILSVLLTALALSCSKDQEAQNTLAYETIISAHTSGVISRESPIRIRFADDVVEETALNAVLGVSPVLFEPALVGVAVWSNRRTLEFRPANRLPAAQAYLAKVSLNEFMETSEGLTQFEFRFTTMTPTFEISFAGVQTPDNQNIGNQEIRGELISADAENGVDIEKVVTANQDGNDLDMQWTHNSNKRRHLFLITGVTRKQVDSSVRISWQGTEIGAEVKGQRDFSIPSINSFEAISARAVQGATEYIEVRFSDPLQVTQNLRGLIAINAGDQYQKVLTGLRYTIQNNIVQVYNNSRWDNAVQVTVNEGIRNVLGGRLSESKQYPLVFNEVKPQVRFVGKQVIVPSTQGQTIPIETVNLRSVIVEAVRIYETNMPQFLQVNNLEGEDELRRVGRIIWKKTVSLDYTADKQNRWVRYGLDISPLIAEHPQGMYRITLSFNRRHIVYHCPEDPPEEDLDYSEDELESWDEASDGDSYWDYSDIDWSDYYNNRNNPCHPAFYRPMYGHDITASHNILISDIGLIAKKGSHDDLFIAVTDLQSAQPLAGVDVEVLDYQQQALAVGRTDDSGMLMLQAKGTPFLVVANHGDQAGYLKIDSRSVLSVSHFDIAGETVEQGIKGFIYGERGVWRPGDPIYQTFILYDTEGTLPDNHPVVFELRNARGQLVKTVRRTAGLNGFYHVKFETEPDAPTGNWMSTVRVGGATFEKGLKVATVMPNRLKIDLDLGEGVESLQEGNMTGILSAQWLHGAIARNLKVDIEMELAAATTRFQGYEGYAFDDPITTYDSAPNTIFEGRLNARGDVEFQSALSAGSQASGMLAARFTNRVFEESGAFSLDQITYPFHPYDKYVGILSPEGDRARGMLLTDTTHVVLLAAVDTQGKPVPKARVEVKLYKIKWRWWWEQGDDEALADYAGTSSFNAIQTDTIELTNGRGAWPLLVAYPSWGRYLITARDLDGGHRTGKVVHIDWPGWAGRGQKQNPGGATILAFASDKTEYTVGEQVTLTIPTGQEGRGLVSIETGTRILKTEWIESTGPATQYTFEATPEMAPNVYAHVTFLQPHLQTKNDLPIRMYGVIPITVTDPQTRLNPQIAAADVFQPDAMASIQVRETSAHPMTYTLAVVDEGLLGLTRFTTPDPWNHFYKRESLGVKTWDYFDDVAGAYGGSFERLIAIGGGDDLLRSGQNNTNRFPPVVQFLGPFELDAGATNTHEVEIPQYVGAVRVMAVAAHEGAFGRTEKSVFVRKPLMVQGTLPRILGPEETVDLPIAVFALEDHVRDVTLFVDVDGPISIEGAARQSLRFSDPGDQIVSFRLKTERSTGIATVTLNAESGRETASQTISIGVRLPSQTVAEALDTLLTNGGTWTQPVTLPGMPGTNTALLEISRIPPLNLGKRIDYLIRYPHGCIEQVTSAAFAQLNLDLLLNLPQDRQDQIESHIKAAIERLHSFQTATGGFTYWPGESAGHYWASNYAGHFLLDAQVKGYAIPAGMLSQWEKFQRNAALSWTPEGDRAHLIQAYRLYTLARAGAPELGAMNRLRETKDLTTVARWRLASAYQLASQSEAARALAQTVFDVEAERELSNTFGSPLRDKAMILESLTILEKLDEALPLVQDISEVLASSRWCSTHESAYALMALAQYYNLVEADDEMAFAVSWDLEEDFSLSSTDKVVQRRLTVAGTSEATLIVRNTGRGTIFPRLIMEGIPAPGQEQRANNGLAMTVVYKNSEEMVIQPASVEQGTDIMAEVTIKNTALTRDYKALALSHLAPSGWEIRNDRLRASESTTGSTYDYQDIRDDRVYTYFDLKRSETKTFRLLLNASYLGRYYLPMISVEAMYDGGISARVPGEWTSVVRPGN